MGNSDVKRHCFSKRGETMYEGFYEKSSGYAMAAGMLLNTMSLLHANDNSVQADEGAKGTT